MTKKRLKVALVHDYLRTFGGGERVLLTLIDLFPKADIFVASANYENNDISHYFKKHKNKLNTAWIQSIRLFRIKPIFYRPFLPIIWKSFNFSGYDLVISSSGSNMAFCISVPDKIPHICYCHTPPKFLMDKSSTESGLHNNKALKFLTKPYLLSLNRIAKKSADAVSVFIANSYYIQLKIKKYFKADAIVVYPPLMLECASLTQKKHREHRYLVVSRLEKNKNLELIIEAFNKSKRKLVIVGNGRQDRYLKRISNNNIEFLGFISDDSLIDLYATSKALIVAAQDEDFGLSVIESLSQGTPVVAPYEGGFKETIQNGITGFFYYSNAADALNQALDQLETSKIDSSKCIQLARGYHKNIFNKKMMAIINEKLKTV